jgi:hypothetical protein
MGGGTLSRMGMREFGYPGEVYAKSQTWMICKVDSLSGAGIVQVLSWLKQCWTD